MSLEKNIKSLRKMIDKIDYKILSLLNKRANLAEEIGKTKNKNTIYRPDREFLILKNLKQKNTGPLSNNAINNIFKSIMNECLSLEKKLTVAYLGPEGTFTQEATISHFGKSIITKPCISIDEAFNETESENCDYLVVPIENSIEGSVNRTLDLLVNSNLKICGEIYVKIHQNLLSKFTTDKIKTLYSHEQSIAQCYQWIKKNIPSNVKIIPSTSNAEAAHLASKNNFSAAIASVRAADIYNLNIIEKNIEDIKNNTTRFLVLGKQDVEPTGYDKTTLIISTKNKPGAMFNILKEFAENNIDFTKLESRPAKTKLWEYNFFIEIKGHITNKNIQNALNSLEKKVNFIKNIGSYPISDDNNIDHQL